jgi:16S rRNA A1518/A1519 N6-dimethyltransferase RsmA/KsgA/DIM1 with predicted DNA glycosylase/AP lyase activity
MNTQEIQSFMRFNPHDKLQHRKEHGNVQSNLDFLQSTGLLNSQQRILEIGSGYGTLLNELWTRGFQVQGAEVDSRCVETARQRCGCELPLTLVEREALPFKSDSLRRRVEL